MKVIECTDLNKNFLKKPALSNLTFSIEENTITGIIGRNGVGKTTLLKIIAGFIRETSGEISVFSESPFNSLNVSVNSIFVDDQMSFPPALQLGELLTESKRFYPNWNEDLARGLFDYFKFDVKAYHNRLSKGKISTFNMIIGLASRCPLTIFDEPTTGMDEGVRKDFYRALLKDYIAHPRTIILSSHHIDEIVDLLEDVLFIHNGKKLLHLPISELKDWTIGVKGDSKKIENFANGKEVFYRNKVGVNTSYAVVKKEYLKEARQAGLEISPVRLSDLFVYLTTESNRGIDDVFKD